MEPLSQPTKDVYQQASARYTALGLLTIAYVFNFIDRQILTILQESIKAELVLSDTQLGLLTGFAFALFYVVMGLPIARWADRGNRQSIIALSIAVWSGFTALSGSVQNFWQLLMVRIGVGVGEAGCSPPAHSMLSDIFPRSERATALSVYNTGISVGVLFGFLVGGWINEFFGWRAAFLAVGLPGLLLALVVKVWLKEPIRNRLEPLKDQKVEEPPALTEVLAVLWRAKTFRCLMLSSTLFAFAGYGLLNWLPSFYIRVHSMSTGALGTWFSLIIGIGGAVGTIGCGVLCDRLGKQDARWYCWVTAIFMACAVPCVAALLLVADTTVSLLLFIIPGVVLAAYPAPLIAVTHGLVNNRMRAFSSAVVYLILNLLGLGIGPVAIGALSDGLSAQYGADGLRYAMVSMLPICYVLGVIFALLAARYIREDLRA